MYEPCLHSLLFFQHFLDTLGITPEQEGVHIDIFLISPFIFLISPYILCGCTLTLVLLNPDILCLCKQCRSRSDGFWSQLIWICTVCHSVWELMSIISIKTSYWLTFRSGCGILNYSAWQGLINSLVVSLNNEYPQYMFSWSNKNISAFGWNMSYLALWLESILWVLIRRVQWWGTYDEKPQRVFVEK